MDNFVDVKEIMKTIKSREISEVSYNGDKGEWFGQIKEFINDKNITCDIKTIEEVLKESQMQRYDNLKNGMCANQVVNYYRELDGGVLKRFLKKCVRKLMKCIALPLACEQTEFNKNACAIIMMQQEEIQELRKKIDILIEEK